jgi:hypothetical protein
MGPIEVELDKRILTLSDYSIRWVRHVPQNPEEACLVLGPYNI